MASPITENCPCDSGALYTECCGPIHDRDAGLGTRAEQLMRARYSAFVLNNADFLLRSWHPDTRPAELSLEPGRSWQGLTIVETVGGSGMEQTGIVQFTARFRRGGEDFELHERSSFARVSGKWQYLDGVDPNA
ncbi:MAG: YchJ family protein [Acidimicrobiales bacterium]